MKRVTLIVHVFAEVPDDTDLEELCLDNKPSDFIVGSTEMPVPLAGAKVTDFRTEEVVPEYE